jgi:hypothetical protein
MSGPNRVRTLNLRFKVRLQPEPDPRFRFGFGQKVPEPEPNRTVATLAETDLKVLVMSLNSQKNLTGDNHPSNMIFNLSSTNELSMQRYKPF